MSDPYRILGLEPGATHAEIKRAWRRVARQHHPDLNPEDPGAADRFKEAHAAYEQLMQGEGPVRRTVEDEEAWLDTLIWMIEARQLEVRRQLLPRYAAQHGFGLVLIRAMLDQLPDRFDVTPDTRPSLLVRLRLWWLLRKLEVGVAQVGSPWQILSVVPNARGGATVLISARALATQGLDEETLRELMRRAVAAGMIAATRMLLSLPPVPATIEQAHDVERQWRAQLWFWRAVWIGLAAICVGFIGWAMFGR